MDHLESQVKPILRVVSTSNSSQLDLYLQQQNAYAGIEFPDYYANLTNLPEDLTYSIRYPGELRRTANVLNPLFFNWRTDFLFPQFSPGGARNYHRSDDGAPSGYYSEGFLFLQHFLFRSFATMKNNLNINITDLPKITIRVKIIYKL